MASVKELKREVKRWKECAESALSEVEALRKELKGVDENAGKEGKTKPRDEKKAKKEKPRREKSVKKAKKEKKGKKAKGHKRSADVVEITEEADLHLISTGSSMAEQREAWKRHSFLRDRYEFHMAEGKGKPESRLLANNDLEKKYGAAFGFSEDQLDGILT